MTERVRFYCLNQKFVEREADIPEYAQQVMYYSLAIGHHVGVIDCLKAVLDCPLDQYLAWIDYLPQPTEAHAKLARLLKFGEITVDITHVNLLADAFLLVRENQPEPFKCWTETLLELLEAMTKEPAMYLMIKYVGQ